MQTKAEISNQGTMAGRIAELLLRSEAVTLNVRQPYRYASGILSPIYCDNRLLLAFPEWREMIVKAFCDRIREIEPGPRLVAGVATAGIAWAAWIADRLRLPLAYVRGAAKGHGKGNRIEGVAEAGTRAVVIEDLLSTGGSSATAVEALREAGLDVAACLAIFSYLLPACKTAFDRLGCPVGALTDFDVLMQTAGQLRIVPPADLQAARSWNRDPQAWGAQHGA